MLVDAGLDVQEINDKVLSLNSKLEDKLEEMEIQATIMRTVTQKVHERDIRELTENKD